MKFQKRIKQRLNMAIVYLVYGLIAMAIGFFKTIEVASSVGLVFAVMGIARILQYRRLIANQDAFKQREIAETDERNVAIWTKARALAFSVFIIVAGISVSVFYLAGLEGYGKIVAGQLFLFMLIYWICYGFIKRKY